MKKSKSKIFFSYRPGIGFWIILILMSLVPLSIGKFGITSYMLPQIELSIIFFTSIYLRIASWQVFLYGLLIDVSYGKPIGITPLLILLIFYIIGKLRTKLENLEMRAVILHFTYTLIVAKILELVILSIHYSSNIVPYYSEIIINILVNIAFYILLHHVLHNKFCLKYHENK